MIAESPKNPPKYLHLLLIHSEVDISTSIKYKHGKNHNPYTVVVGLPLTGNKILSIPDNMSKSPRDVIYTLNTKKLKTLR